MMGGKEEGVQNEKNIKIHPCSFVHPINLLFAGCNVHIIAEYLLGWQGCEGFPEVHTPAPS